MDDDNPTSFINMIKDLRSGTESYRKSGGVPLRFSGTGYKPSILGENDEDIVTPKRRKLNESDTSVADKSLSDSVPGSPWEWRRLKGEVTLVRLQTTVLIAQILLYNYIYTQLK